MRASSDVHILSIPKNIKEEIMRLSSGREAWPQSRNTYWKSEASNTGSVTHIKPTTPMRPISKSPAIGGKSK